MAYTKDIGIRDFYNQYKRRAVKLNREYLDYKKYSEILKDINLMMRDSILYQASHITLPYRLGKLGVYKFKVVYNPDRIKKWKVDFKATKEKGYVIYYGSEHGYKWKWDKRNGIFKNKKWFNFKPCRKASRLIADAVNNKGLDYYMFTNYDNYFL